MNHTKTNEGSTTRSRVMVVDDSAVIRGLITRSLEEDPEIAVVATAANGEIAVKALSRHDVDVIILDIEMPVMDGLTALPLLLKAQPGVQVIMASTLTRRNAEVSLRALSAGATDYVTKPSSAEGPAAAAAFREALRNKVKALASGGRRETRPRSGGASATTHEQPPVSSPTPVSLRSASAVSPSVLAIGSSTGGPQALFKVLGDLRGSLSRIPVVITQHMPATFTTLLAEHIARVTDLPCQEACEGAVLRPGHIYIAPGGWHMRVRKASPDADVSLHIDQGPYENYCRPSVDPMLRSLVPIFGERMIVLILTGMGSDGLKGAREAAAAGATVLAQDEQSSVVWGMPGAVATEGLCSAVLPLHEIGPYLRGRFLGASR